MSIANYYKICKENMARPVFIQTIDGEVHQGRIIRVTNSRVYLKPLGKTITHQRQGKLQPLGKTAITMSKKEKGSQVFWGVALNTIGSLFFPNINRFIGGINGVGSFLNGLGGLRGWGSGNMGGSQGFGDSGGARDNSFLGSIFGRGFF